MRCGRLVSMSPLVEPGAFKTNILKSSTATEQTIADYDDARRAVRRTMHEVAQKGDDPRKVALLILKIARTRLPRLRYGVGRDGRWLPYLKVLSPQRFFDYLLRRGFGLLREE